MSPRTLLLTATAVALTSLPAAAQAAAPAHMVGGPHGTAILRPADHAQSVAFVVRAGRRPVSGYVRLLSAAGTRQYSSEPVRLRPGRTFRVAATPLRADRVRVVYDLGAPGHRRTRVAYLVTRVPAAQAPAAAPDAPGGAPADAPDPDTEQQATHPSPGAQAPDAAAPETTWTAAPGLRKGGRSCVTVAVFTPGIGLSAFPPAFCGRLDLDPFYARTKLLGDGAARRLVLAGAVAPSRVAAVSVTGPDGTRPLPLSPRIGDGEGTEGAFIAVYDASVTVDALTLTVTLTDGTVLTQAAPRAVNLRDAAGNPL